MAKKSLGYDSASKINLCWVDGLEIIGSNPTPAIKKLSGQDDFHGRPVFLFFAAQLTYSTIEIICVMLVSLELC